jgi:hypothetical protein
MVALTGEVYNTKAGAQAAKPRSTAIIVAIDCLAGRGALQGQWHKIRLHQMRAHESREA